MLHTFHTKIVWWETRLKKSEKHEPASTCQQQVISFCFVLEMMEQKSDKTAADTDRCVLSQHKNVQFANSTKSKKMTCNHLCKVVADA